jgi:4-oxalocrotonate tautomerase
MPIVTIQVTREGTAPGATSTTPEQKAALIEGVSRLLLEVMGKPMDSTFVIIEEVELENWGWHGLPVTELRRRRGASSGDVEPPADAGKRGVS